MAAQAEARAVARYVRMTPRKLRLVVDLIRGKRVKEAFEILKFVPKHGAKVVAKVLKSAVANAENEPYKMDADSLYVSTAMVDQGPTIKRWIPRAQGRASAIHKRMSHVTIRLREREEHEAPRKRRTVGKVKGGGQPAPSEGRSAAPKRKAAPAKPTSGEPPKAAASDKGTGPHDRSSRRGKEKEA